MKKNIAIITNAGKNSGVGSRAFQLMEYIGEQNDIEVSMVMLDGKNNVLTCSPLPTGQAGSDREREREVRIHKFPSFLGSKSVSWIRLARYIPRYDVYDISNQTLSFIAKKRTPSIVTVHDIIELTHPQDTRARFLNKYLMSGIMHADRIVAVSEYTKKSLQEYYGISESSILVIPNGVHKGYQEIPNFTSSLAYQELNRAFGLAGRHPIILSVGSEHPRKNMKTVLRAVAHVKKQFPNVLLLKVGEAGLLSGRQEMLDMIDQLGLAAHVKLLGNIPIDTLNELYNSADALLFPSRHEGFGLPVLEAMAALCPVVCSNAASLPEVAGDGAIMHDAEDYHAFAESIIHLTTNSEFRKNITEKGKKRASQFSWEKAARDMLKVYKNL